MNQVTKTRLHSLLTKLFDHEEINGGGICETYLHRWVIARFPGGRAIYLHHFVGDDWSRDLHDHPKRFITIGLAGGYDEQFKAHGEFHVKRWRAPWIRTFPATHIHRLRSKHLGGCWTLVYVGALKRNWGFWKDGIQWWPWDYYVKHFGLDRKDC